MARDGDIKLRISGDEQDLDKSLRRSKSKVSTWGQGVMREVRRMNTQASAMLKRAVVNPITGLIGGAAILAAGKQIVDFNARVARLAIQAGVGADEQMRLRQEIMATADATGQGREDILAGMDAIVERLGDLGLARYLIKDMGIASTATGARMEDIGALAANLYDKMGLAREEIGSALNLLTVQGKAGAFTLKNLAELGERLFSAGAGANIKGLGGLREFGAFIQIARKGTGSAEMATTAVERTLSEIIEKSKDIKKVAKFDVFDPEKSKGGVKVLKNFDTVLKGIIKGTKGDIPTLLKIFGQESIRAIRPLALLYQETGNFDLYDQFKSADVGRQGELMKDFARYTSESAFAFSRLQNAGTRFADLGLSRAIASLTDELNALTSDPERMREFEQTVVAIGSAIGVIAKMTGMAVRGWSELLNLWGTANEKFADWIFRTSPEDLRRAAEGKGRTGFSSVRAGTVALKAARYMANPMQAIPEVAKMGVETIVNVFVDPAGKTTAETTTTNGKARTNVRTNRGDLRHVK